LTPDAFQELYGADPFYSWIGLDSPLVYAAHRVAGGITSIYRQVGIGCERLFRRIVEDSLGLDPSESAWSYALPADEGGKQRRLSLDARIPLAALEDASVMQRVRGWLVEASARVGIPASKVKHLEGAVFEVRQGYKSMDSKRQNADLQNAVHAYASDYLPVIAVFSQQIDHALIDRYTRAKILVLLGELGGSSVGCTYAFCSEVLGYDLAAFFTRNSRTIRKRVHATLETLLSAT
jgi:hypothetical protein